METMFFLVSQAEQYLDAYGYHEHFFLTSGGFATALGIAAGVALLMALIFYFGLCMSHKTIGAAILPTWGVFLLAAGAVSFVVTNSVLIGSNDPDAANYESSFYYDMEEYYLEIQEGVPATEKDAMNKAKNEIIEYLNQGDDVANKFNLNTAIWSMFFFYVFSIVIKGFSVNGVAIPHLKPHGLK